MTQDREVKFQKNLVNRDSRRSLRCSPAQTDTILRICHFRMFSELQPKKRKGSLCSHFFPIMPGYTGPPGNNVIYSQDQGYSFLGFRILNPECLF